MESNKFDGILDIANETLTVQWKPELTLNLKLVNKKHCKYTNYADNILIVGARRGRRHVNMIYQYDVIEEEENSNSKIVELTLLAELPVRP